MRPWGIAILIVLSISVQASRADVLTLSDGRSLEGKVRIETSRRVYFEVRSEESTRLEAFPRSAIVSLVRSDDKEDDTKADKLEPADSGDAEPIAVDPDADTTAEPGEARYFRVPLRGVVGREFTAAAIEEAFEAGLRDPATVLVLEIDSPGGLVSECEKIIELLARHEERRSIAYVVDALSAAAIISLTCDEIYMHEKATIGAALAIRNTEFGVSPVDEKFHSVWRATCRRAAEIGGHDALFAEAMTDPDLQLRVLVDRNGTRVEQVFPRDAIGRDGRMITTAGKLLTATAREARSYGLAAGVVEELDGIPKLARGISSWTQTSTRGEKILEKLAARVRRVIPKIEAALEKAQDEFDLAVEFDPTRQQLIRSRPGRPWRMPGSLWAKYSRRCAEHLDRCGKAFRDAAKLGKGYPFLELLTEIAKKREEEIEEVRSRIKASARRAA